MAQDNLCKENEEEERAIERADRRNKLQFISEDMIKGYYEIRDLLGLMSSYRSLTSFERFIFVKSIGIIEKFEK